jgi:hypothetical protein
MKAVIDSDVLFDYLQVIPGAAAIFALKPIRIDLRSSPARESRSCILAISGSGVIGLAR